MQCRAGRKPFVPDLLSKSTFVFMSVKSLFMGKGQEALIYPTTAMAAITTPLFPLISPYFKGSITSLKTFYAH